MALPSEKLNFLSLLACGLVLASIVFPWWGVDISGPSLGISHSFRWYMWAGPITNLDPGQPYSEMNNLSQVLTSGTAILGTLALDSAVLLFAGVSSKRSKFLQAGLALSGFAAAAYVGIAGDAVQVAHAVWPVGCISGAVGSCIDGPPGPGSVALVWGFQLGFYLLVAGAITAFLATIFDLDILQVHKKKDPSQNLKQDGGPKERGTYTKRPSD